MPRRCCLCSAVSGVSFHGFPKNKEGRKMWKKICNYKECDDVSNLHICSRHFFPSDYINFNAKKFGGRLALKPDHFPSINVPSKYIHPEEVTIKQDIPHNDSAIECKSPTVSRNIEEISSTSLRPICLLIKTETVTETPDVAKQSPLKQLEFPSFKIQSVYTIKSEPVAETSEVLERKTVIETPEDLKQKPGAETSDNLKQELVTETSENVEPLAIPSKFEMSFDLTESTDEAKFSASKKKRFYEPRYLGDVTFSDMRSPKTAWKSIQLAKETIKKVQFKNKVLRAKNCRLMKKIVSLEEMIIHLKKQKNFTRRYC